jgi:hypothetical protein
VVDGGGQECVITASGCQHLLWPPACVHDRGGCQHLLWRPLAYVDAPCHAAGDWVDEKEDRAPIFHAAGDWVDEKEDLAPIFCEG